MKINRRNFDDAPHGSAIFEDIKMKKRKNLICLERERDFSLRRIRNFEDVLHGSVIFENRGATSLLTVPYSKTVAKGGQAYGYEVTERRLFADAPSESAIF